MRKMWLGRGAKKSGTSTTEEKEEKKMGELRSNKHHQRKWNGGEDVSTTTTTLFCLSLPTHGHWGGPYQQVTCFSGGKKIIFFKPSEEQKF